MAERRHGPSFDQVYVVSSFDPASEPFPWELGPPSEAADDGLQHLLGRAPQAGLRPDATDEDDLAARSYDTRKLVERRLGAGNRGNHVMRHDDVE